MIYFDNAATTHKKPRSVLREIYCSLKNYGGNPGRSGHTLSVKASEKIYTVREKISEFLSYQHPELITFTHNATYALNTAIFGLVREGCHVLISDLEHNSVLRPIYHLCETKGIEYSIFSTSSENLTKEIESHIRPDTKFIISTLSSNVSGKEIPLSILYHVKKKHNLKLIVDASQLIGHKKIDLGRYPCDALCAPGHKALFGICGCGFSVFGKDSFPDPWHFGGSGSDSKNPFMPEYLPERMEAGTLAVPAIASLGAGISYINSVGIGRIEEKLKDITDLTVDRLESIKGIKIYGANAGTVSFNIGNFAPEKIAYDLNKERICVRAGLHCAPLAHSSLGSLERGSVRVSYSVFNTQLETDKFYKALKRIVKNG